MRNLQYFGQDVLCIVSCTEDAELCYSLDVPYCWHSNDMLGAKWNFGLEKSKDIDWDYIVTLGSDDIIKESLLTFYDSIGEQDVVITDKIHFIDSTTGKATSIGEISRARIGAGRRISRRVIEKCGYKLWTPSKNKSLDMDSNACMNRAGFATTETRTQPHIVGLKSEVNIWGYSHLEVRGRNISLDIALEGVPERTKKDVIALLEKSVKFVKTNIAI